MGGSHSRGSSREPQAWHSPKPRIPQPQAIERKVDLAKEGKKRSPPAQFQPMFRHFQYPQKVPKIPEKIHRGQGRKGRVNTTVTDNEMRPSYSSHQSSRILTPDSMSSDSEEELLYRADEGLSERLSEPPSLVESNYASGSEGEPEFGETMPITPYQAVEEDHYKSGNTSFRSVPKAPSVRAPSELSSKSMEARLEEPTKKPKKKKKKHHKSKKKRQRSPSDQSLTPLPEEDEVKEKRGHKARTPPSFHVKKPPPPSSPPPPQYLPQPIIYQMPQPFPMPIPMYPPMPQYFFHPPMPQQMYPQYSQYQPPPPPPIQQEPERRRVQEYRRERHTQYATSKAIAQTTTEHSLSPPRNNPSFVEALAEIDLRLTPPQSLHPDDIKYPKPVALEIGIGESKSLAEHFQEKLPEISAKMNSRNNERSRLEHKDKSTTQLLEIRKEMLKAHTPRMSTSRGSSVDRLDSSSVRRLNPIQLEKLDRLAAGRPSVVNKKAESGVGPGAIVIVAKKEIVETVVVPQPVEAPKPSQTLAIEPKPEVKIEPPKPVPVSVQSATSPKTAIGGKKEPPKKQPSAKKEPVVLKTDPPPPAAPSVPSNNDTLTVPAEIGVGKIAEIKLKSVEEEKKVEEKKVEEKKEAAGKQKSARTTRAPVKIQ